MSDYEVLTSNGFKDFDDVIFKGSKSGLLIQTENHSISVTKNHKFYINGDFVYARDLKVQDLVQTDTGLEKIIKITETSDDYYDLINVRDGHHFTANGIEVSNCAWIPPNQFKNLMDSLLPSQAAMSWKKNIFISTPNGMNHFYDLVEGARRRKVLYGLSKAQLDKTEKVLSWKQSGEDSYDVTVDEPSNNHALFEMDWRDVPRYNSKGQRLDPEDFKNDIITKYGLTYFSQNFACDFIGSSHTLISPDILKELKPQDPEMILAHRLKVYKEPEEKHKYIMGVDPAKFGSDSFAIQVLDVTTFPFVQVASAKLPDENFQIMPQYLYEWGKWYNEALMIVESNDGAGTYANTVLHNDYEYENLYFEKTFGTFDHKTKTKIEPGFRTNVKNRALILDTLKLLIDHKRLIINDKDTIKEFTTFILKNNKFQADDGFHDDLIMALCIALAPFSDVKNFDNFTELVNKMYSKDAESVDFSDFLCLGDFDDYSDLEVSDDTPESVLFEIQSKSLRGF